MGRRKRILEGIEIVTYAAEGKCIARHNDLVIFVKGVIPGDVVDLVITKKKKQYLEAKPIKFIKYSQDRVEPFCEHYGLCGGCKWQDLPYELQLKYKHQQVIDNLERIGKIQIPEIDTIIGSDTQTHYRNKMEYTFSDNRWLLDHEVKSEHNFDRRGVGFHIPEQHDKVVDVHTCHLQIDVTNKIRNFVREFAIENDLSFYNLKEFKGLLRTLMIRNTSLNEIMVMFQFGADEPENISLCLEALKNKFPEITSLYYTINLKKNDSFFDQEITLYSGKKYITENLSGLHFNISPKSFFQTNTSQAEKLYSKVLEFAKLTGEETVYDLYTGTGTIANFLASKSRLVVGVETIGQAIEDAKLNASINDIENTIFLEGDAKELFNNELFNQYGSPDVLITDPPRAGMHADLIQTILAQKPGRIVYVSCNPATQARDLALLDQQYKVEKVQPVDMFPHTHHVENIVSLTLMN